MNLKITRTSDGSDTLFHPGFNQHYHSTFGAIQESQHIYIRTGLLYAIEYFHAKRINLQTPFNILEIGFGTGLNALLTQMEAEKLGMPVHYTAIEAFPLDESCWGNLNYPHMLGAVDGTTVFGKLHLANWNEPRLISPHFTLHKIHKTLEEYSPLYDSFDLVYFDAFGPDVQPELWTGQVFSNLWKGLITPGILVTYSVKGEIVRAMHSAGFQTEKLSGPPGKRHILRAVKI